MSRIGKQIIEIPSGVNVDLKGQHIKVKGPKGELEMDCHPEIKVVVGDNGIEVVNDKPENRKANQLHGTMRALIAIMVTGVIKGFERKREI